MYDVRTVVGEVVMRGFDCSPQVHIFKKKQQNSKTNIQN